MNYEQSESVAAIGAALSKAQIEITAVVKGSDNEYFDSKFADLAACWEGAHGPLNKNDIAIFQGVSRDEHGLVLVTQLTHKSGEWMRHGVPLMVNGKNPMQALGSAITYGRRYGLCAAVGLAQKDDDGNSAHDGKAEAKTAAPDKMPPKPPTDKAKVPIELQMEDGSRQTFARTHHGAKEVMACMERLCGPEAENPDLAWECNKGALSAVVAALPQLQADPPDGPTLKMRFGALVEQFGEAS